MSDGECYVIIILVVLLVLCGKAVAHIKILYVVAMTTQICIRLPLPRLWMCGFSSALIVRLGATPICVPFRPQCNFMASIIKHPPVLELFIF